MFKQRVSNLFNVEKSDGGVSLPKNEKNEICSFDRGASYSDNTLQRCISTHSDHSALPPQTTNTLHRNASTRSNRSARPSQIGNTILPNDDHTQEINDFLSSDMNFIANKAPDKFPSMDVALVVLETRKIELEIAKLGLQRDTIQLETASKAQKSDLHRFGDEQQFFLGQLVTNAYRRRTQRYENIRSLTRNHR